MGLRLCETHGANAIYQRLVRRYCFRLVRLALSTGNKNAATAWCVAIERNPDGTHSRNNAGAGDYSGKWRYPKTVRSNASPATWTASGLHSLPRWRIARTSGSSFAGRTIMILLLDLVVRLALWMLLAPLLPGIINKVKAWVAGRRGTSGCDRTS